jgi:hypothetical protein
MVEVGMSADSSEAGELAWDRIKDLCGIGKDKHNPQAYAD